MTESDLAVLDSILTMSKSETAPEMEDDEFFELFSAHKILRDFQLDPDDIDSGLVGSNADNREGSDGGIDGFFLFANGKIIRDSTEAEKSKDVLKKNALIDIVIIQASRQRGFTIDRLTRLKDTCEDIFSFNKEPRDFSEQYNEFLLDARERLRTLYRVLATRYPSYTVSLFYVTKGDTGTISPDISGTAKDTSGTVSRLLPIAKPVFTFLGARELIELASKPPKLDFTLKCSAVIPSQKAGGYVALMPIREYLKFITSDDGQLRTTLFESNVRDYQGKVAVNEAIENTLLHPGAEDFWWLNNGITIVAEKASADVREVTLGEPQIVNGLQTSQKIFDYSLSEKQKATNDQRELLLRVIKAPTVESHDAIIQATNSQTAIPQAYLWATSQIHRDVQSYFRSKDLYYDRRKNSWRREGIPLAKVVGITELAQSVAAILRQEPDHARARPARYFAKKHHGTIFADKYNLDMYIVCARLKKKATLFLRSTEKNKQHRNNLLFYLLTAVTCIALKTRKPRDRKIAELNLDKVDDAVFQKAIDIVKPIYKQFGRNDKAAKGAEMAEELRTQLHDRFAVGKRRGKT